jgi:hypothetical protein|tara:strand:- start:1963 stop:2400 length:438 start_codon:yes stop_codon:yes gene_type:complete
VEVNFISLEVNFVMEIEEEIGLAFFEAVGAGDLERAFEYTTKDVTFTPIGTHPVIGKEFRGKEDILQNCWMYVFEHLTEAGVPTVIKGSAFGKGIGFIEFSGSGQGRSGMPYNNVYCHIYRYEGEKICAISEYLDTDLVNKLLSQ